MQPDSASTHSAPAERQWVEAELVRGLMRNARNMQVIGIGLVLIFVGVLWDDAPTWVLIVWAVVSLGVAGARYAVFRDYVRRAMAAGPAADLAYFERRRLLWPTSALVWGLSAALFFDRAPLPDQFICWLAMAGLGMFSINNLSSHLHTMRMYLDVLAVTVLAVLLWRIGVDLHFHASATHWWMVLLVAVFWQVLRQAGLRLHLTHRRNYELQFRNNQLIQSLRRQTQAALDAVEIKNRFLASAAHDIRQPVHALGLYADWLGSEPELVYDIAPKIVQSTKAVNALFDSLFDLVRLDSGKVRLNIEPVEIGAVLRELELQYRPLAQSKGLDFRVWPITGTVTSDPMLLRRIVGNLVSNAIKYTEHGGVLLAARRRHGRVCLEVWDTGRGIAPVHQREIFREFFKVPTHGGTEDGFGLGLYIVSRLAAILGHPIELASRPGRGTVFRVVLAPTDPQQAAERASSNVAQLVSIP